MNRKRFVKNIFSNWVAFFIQIVVAFILSPFLIHRLGDSTYGLWIMVISFTGYFGVLDLGVMPSIVKYVSEFRAKKDDEKLSSYVNTCFFIYLATGLFTSLVILSLSYIFPEVFKLSDDIRDVAGTVVILVGLNVALAFPFNVFNGIIVGFQRYDIEKAVKISFVVMGAVLTIVLLSRGHGIVTLALILLSTTTMSNITSFIFSRKLYPGLRIRPRQFKPDYLKLIFNFSSASFMVAVSWRLLFLSDSLVIGYFLPTAMVTFYAIASNIIRYFREMLYGFSFVFTPAVSEVNAMEDNERMRSMVINGTKLASLTVFPIGLFLICYGDMFITLWIGEGYESSYYVLYILVIAQLVSLPQHVSESFLFGINEHQRLAKAVIIEAVCNIVLSIVLIQYMGIIGVALGTLIPRSVVYLFWLPNHICGFLNVGLRRYILESFGLPVVLAAVYLAILLYARTALTLEKTWLNLIGVFLFSGAIFTAFSYQFYLKKLIAGAAPK